MPASIIELDITPGNSEDEAVLIVVWTGDASLIEIDWGDGKKESLLADGDRLAVRHDYAGKPGTHSISVSVHSDSETPSNRTDWPTHIYSRDQEVWARRPLLAFCRRLSTARTDQLRLRVTAARHVMRSPNQLIPMSSK